MKRVITHKAFSELIPSLAVLILVTALTAGKYPVIISALWAVILLVAVPLRIYTIKKGNDS